MDFKTFLIVLTLVASSSQVPEIKTLYTNSPGYSEYFALEENLAGGTTLRFSVRTSRDAHILLATTPERNQPEYEIVLGALDNTVNYIRGRYPDQREPNSAIRTVNLLNEHEFRDLWIKLKRDSLNTTLTIQVGAGKYDFQEWRDTTPLRPLYLSFGSKTWAHWRYGFADNSNVKAFSKDRKVACVTFNDKGSTYGQYHPLSDIISHSDDNSSTIYFAVQTPGEFQILLSPLASPTGDRYEFGLKKSSAYLRRHQADTEGNSAQNITQSYSEDGISNDTHRLRYWITLARDGQIMIGKGGSLDPFLFWLDPHPIFPQFIAFTLIEPEHFLYPPRDTEIEYGLGPDYKLKSHDCEARWKNAIDREIPAGAVRGGYTDKEELFVCRANHGETYLPGSFIASGINNKGECQVAYDINVHKKTDFQVLTGCNFAWVAASLGEVPEGAVLAGKISDSVNVHVARVSQDGQVIVGKLHSNEQTAYAAVDNQELPFTDYEILVQYKQD